MLPFLVLECHGAHHLCSHRGEPVLVNVGHHVRAKTNQPIFGILTQPLPDEWNNESLEESTFKSFFESSHADFLQAAGARVVPIDFTKSEKQLKKELANINGLYIPGDTRESFEDDQYLKAVESVLSWASEHNLEEDAHFPVVGVSWGMLAMLRTQTTQLSLFKSLGSDLAGEPLQQNLHLLPKESFLYDEVNGFEFEQTLDEVTFYHEMDEGVTLDDFLKAQQLRHFIPVATFDQGSAKESTLNEVVATMEGTYFPYYGFGYRIDKVQFGFHAATGEAHERVDHSRASVEHAQHIANMLVDEARLSGNRYEFTNDETARLINNYDL